LELHVFSFLPHFDSANYKFQNAMNYSRMNGIFVLLKIGERFKH
jgi:hypothetical protein